MSEWKLVGKAALLIVHMQNAIIKTPSPLEVLGHGKAAYEDGVVANIEGLLKAFRGKGLPVVFCVAYTDPDTKFPVYGGFWPGVKESKANYMGTWDVEVIEELTPAPSEPIFYNWPFNVFENTGLDGYLKEQGHRDRRPDRSRHRHVRRHSRLGYSRAFLQPHSPLGCHYRCQQGTTQSRHRLDAPGHRARDYNGRRHRPSLTFIASFFEGERSAIGEIRGCAGPKGVRTESLVKRRDTNDR